MHAVQIDHVTKTFGTHVAVNDLSLEVPEGAIYGFIGPNGSGKTTTLRMIMRILHPDRGAIRVLGQTSLGSSNDQVGYLPEERGLYKQMKVRDVLQFFGMLKGMGRGDVRKAIEVWLDRMDLSAWGGTRVEALSKGMAQKVQFLAAVINRPRLVLLDEPFSGLDPVNSERLREAVLDLKRGGTTVIFSTHDMAVAEKICDFVFMIYNGHKVLDGTLESIQGGYGEDTLLVRVADHGVALDGLPGVLKRADFGRFQELHLDRDVDPQQVLAAVMSCHKVLHFELTRPSLHEIFVRIARIADGPGPGGAAGANGG